MPLSLRIDVRGLNTALGKLAGFQRAVRNGAVRKALRATCRDSILPTMISLAPVKTGALRDSISDRYRTYRNGRLIMAFIGPRKPFIRYGRRPSRYAHIVELGSSRAAAKPFIRPAWDIHATTFPTRLSVAILRELRAAGAIP